MKAIIFSIFASIILFSCASQGAIRGEEYFAIGMAYYDLGNYDEAQRWLNRARQSDRTLMASEYNLGRIAYETGNFAEAAEHFERVLSRDPENLMALRAAAFSRIRNFDFEMAEIHYNRIMSLLPDSTEDGFNYALVLFGLGRFEETETLIKSLPDYQNDNPAVLLLLARSQHAMGKVEAIDSFARWESLVDPPSAQGLFEYGLALESAGFYARALELFDLSLNNLERDGPLLNRPTIQFNIARLLLIADPENPQGIRELQNAITNGFSNNEAIEAFLLDERLSSDHRDEIRRLLDS